MGKDQFNETEKAQMQKKNVIHVKLQTDLRTTSSKIREIEIRTNEEEEEIVIHLTSDQIRSVHKGKRSSTASR